MEVKLLLLSSRVDLKILKSILFADCEIKGRLKGLLRKLGGVVLWSGVFLVLPTLFPMPALDLVPQCSWGTCPQFWDTQSKCSGWFKLEKSLWDRIEENLLGRALWWDGLIYGANQSWRWGGRRRLWGASTFLAQEDCLISPLTGPLLSLHTSVFGGQFCFFFR